MKKVLSVILCAALLITSAVFASAQTASEDYPVVLVGGFSSSQLIMRNEDGTERKVWMFDAAFVDEQTEYTLWDFFLSLLKLAVNSPADLQRVAKPAIDAVAGVLATDASGNSVNDIYPQLEPTAESARYSGLDESSRIFTNLAEYLDLDNTFLLGADFRLDVLHNVERLELLIDDVLRVTGADKVNIFSQSYGGQIVAAYLSKNADTVGEKVNNVMMTCPAIGGASLAYDFLTGDMNFDEETILEFVEYGFGIESDAHLLLDSDPLEIIDRFVDTVIGDVTANIGTWPSFWDFVPYGQYKELIEEKLDPVANKELIDRTTYFHETYMKNFGVNLRRALDNGVNISILAGSGTPSVTGSLVNSDGIIPVSGATGATPAPWGQRYSDGYKTLDTDCADPKHNHLSPSMEIDASTCYLPENTWIVEKYYHGQEKVDDFTRSLVLRQLLSDAPLRDVHESKAYPQFHAAASRSLAVHAKFDVSEEGRLTSRDQALVVKNTSNSAVSITSVRAKGADIRFDYSDTILMPGEQRRIPFYGTLPEKSLVPVTVTVSYANIGVSTLTPVGSRDFDFLLMNGEAPEYDASSPYTALSRISPTLSSVKGFAALLNVLGRIVLRIRRIIRRLSELFAR